MQRRSYGLKLTGATLYFAVAGLVLQSLVDPSQHTIPIAQHNNTVLLYCMPQCGQLRGRLGYQQSLGKHSTYPTLAQGCRLLVGYMFISCGGVSSYTCTAQAITANHESKKLQGEAAPKFPLPNKFQQKSKPMNTQSDQTTLLILIIPLPTRFIRTTRAC